MTPGTALSAVLSWQRMLLPLASLALLSAFLRTAWVSDDAFITFRVIDNLLHGHGLVWNMGERVQVYTHPLWLLLLGLGSTLTGEHFFTSVGLSALCVALSAWIVIRIARDPLRAALALLVLSLSRAFIDYSSSGLENPLSHLLLLALLWLHQAPGKGPRESTLGWLLAALLMTSRLDLALIGLPMAADITWQAQRGRWAPAIRSAVVGLAPALAWAAFALLYYGSPLPNTFYAKLEAGIDAGEQLRQGIRYYANFVHYDFASAVWIGSGLAVGLITAGQRLVALGLALYLAYVLKIGGDFMAGRFLSAPFVVATILLLVAERQRRILRLPLLMSCFLFMLNAGRTVLSPWDYSNKDVPPDLIVDERGFYFLDHGLWRNLGRNRVAEAAGPVAGMVRDFGSPIVMCYIGAVAYMAGRDIHIIDTMSLTDAFLARLPAKEPWRIGHYERPLPKGYVESVRTGRNSIDDPELAKLWSEIRLVESAPLFDHDRLTAILHANTGRWRQMAARSFFVHDAANFAGGIRGVCTGTSANMTRPARLPPRNE